MTPFSLQPPAMDGHLSRPADHFPEPSDRVRFQHTPSFITQGAREFHITARSAQLADNIKSAFQGSLQSSVAQRGQL